MHLCHRGERSLRAGAPPNGAAGDAGNLWAGRVTEQRGCSTGRAGGVAARRMTSEGSR